MGDIGWGRGSGSVGFGGWILGPPNPRKWVTEPDILNIEPENFGVFREAFTDSMGVSGGAVRFPGFGNEIFCCGGGKLALLCNGGVILGGGDDAGGTSGEFAGAAVGFGSVATGIHVRVHVRSWR